MFTKKLNGLKGHCGISYPFVFDTLEEYYGYDVIDLGRLVDKKHNTLIPEINFGDSWGSAVTAKKKRLPSPRLDVDAPTSKNFKSYFTKFSKRSQINRLKFAS